MYLTAKAGSNTCTREGEKAPRREKYTGGLWVGKFTKTLTYQKVTAEGTEQVAPAAIADAEFMHGHALTCRIRQERVEQRTAAQ